jgi:hypothetical protein
MLQRLGRYIAEAYAHALDAEYQAATAPTFSIRKEYENLAHRWRIVARSFEFNETLERFLMDRDRAREANPPEPPKEPPSVQ